MSYSLSLPTLPLPLSSSVTARIYLVQRHAFDAADSLTRNLLTTSMCPVGLFSFLQSGSKLKPLTFQYKKPSSMRENLTRKVAWR